jgi:chemotaxis protein methyltransferase CheR
MAPDYPLENETPLSGHGFCAADPSRWLGVQARITMRGKELDRRSPVIPFRPAPFLPEVSDSDYVRFLQWALPKIRLRWPGFRKVRGQVRKRIARRLEDLGLSDIASYRGYIETHPEEWPLFDTFCRISISRFYRDRAVYDWLRGRILPELARTATRRGDGVVKVWSAGCACGEEPYTLAILAATSESSHVRDVRLKVIATDANRRLLERARAARYPPSSLKDVPNDWRSRAFQPHGEFFVVRPEFREPVEFFEQDIRYQIPGGPFDLALCRYLVFTYFDESLQRELLGRILERIRPGGIFVVGKRETLPSGDWQLSPYGHNLPIYRVDESRPNPTG